MSPRVCPWSDGRKFFFMLVEGFNEFVLGPMEVLFHVGRGVHACSVQVTECGPLSAPWSRSRRYFCMPFSLERTVQITPGSYVSPRVCHWSVLSHVGQGVHACSIRVTECGVYRAGVTTTALQAFPVVQEHLEHLGQSDPEGALT